MIISIRCYVIFVLELCTTKEEGEEKKERGEEVKKKLGEGF